MPGISVFFSSPTQNTTVGRRQLVTGGIAAFNGSISSVSIQFGAGGPSFNITPANHKANSGVSWGWEGLIPNNIRPGQAFQIIVSAFGQMQVHGGPDPETRSVDDQATGNYVLENVVPVLTMEPFQSPVSTLAASYDKTFSGTVAEANPAVYGTPKVRYRIDDGPLLDATVSGQHWSATASFHAGDHTVTVQASDRFETVTTLQRPVGVFRYRVPAVTDPGARTTRSGIPTTASVTTWTRLEPRCSDPDMATSTSARVLDPLWLMTRQWQLGEFQAEDAGSPVRAHVRATSAALTRCHLGELTAGNAGASPYDPARTPLEAIVERRPMRPTDAGDQRMLTVAVDAGLHFLRMLEPGATARKYRGAFLTHYSLRPPASAIDDDPSARFVQAAAGRAPDARLLAAAFRHPATAEIVFDPALAIALADVPAVRAVAGAWLAWYDGLFSEPTGAADAWTPARLEYAVSVAARLSAEPRDALTLSASGFGGGRLDWSSFDVNIGVGLDTTGDQAVTALSEATIPSPVMVPGTPAPRFWELEDAKVAYGLLTAGPTDLAHLMLIEYASSYGNDWYVVTLVVQVGTVTRVDSLVVTDTFGVRSLLRPIGDPGLPAPHFSLWQPSDMQFPGERLGEPRDPSRPLDPGVGSPVRNRFFLPPSLGRSIDGAAVEDVLFMRDEMANVAWAIERVIESPIERPTRRSELPAGAGPAPAGDHVPRYLLASSVPEHWIPLLPVRMREQAGGPVVLRLRRGGVLQPDGTGRLHVAAGEVLNAGSDLLLHDEEVPREGVRVTSGRRMARWVDGSSWLWTGFRKQVGRGEGSSGLTFDQLLGPESEQP
jgi:hypothetical protein